MEHLMEHFVSSRDLKDEMGRYHPALNGMLPQDARDFFIHTSAPLHTQGPQRFTVEKVVQRTGKQRFLLERLQVPWDAF